AERNRNQTPRQPRNPRRPARASAVEETQQKCWERREL
ncbi:Inorganic triphosphatase (EC 3.6.1.25), partial [Pseudomonas sp. FEN]